MDKIILEIKFLGGTMKKAIFFFLMFLTIFLLFGCERQKYTIALITDIGDIDDKSFNQGSWEGVLQYVEGKNVTYRYYKPTEQSNDAYISAIDLAVANGAEIIITPGFLFEEPINIAQTRHQNTKFVILDGNPASVGTLENNTYSVFYAEEQSGYLAGYAAVKDGYRKLAFMGGMAVPAVVRFGYGFVIGADQAAQELAVDIEIKYHYTGGFSANPTVQATAASLYAGGTEVIFACGGAVGQSVMAAAEAANRKVIGVDVDQSNESQTVITSAMKGLAASVNQALEIYFSGNWENIGGTSVVLDASKEGVGLPMNTSRFNSFNNEQYQTLLNRMKGGEITINHNVSDVTDLVVVRTTIQKIG